MEKHFKKRNPLFKSRFEADFGAGVPERTERRNSDDVFIYPEEIIDRKCGGCMRCEKRDHAYRDAPAEGWHCTMRNYSIDITPDHKACVDYWDKAEHERSEMEHDEAVEKRREELWAVYAEREPVKLPVVNDGYGRMPECPICGEMPYSTEQCHWCGQRFIQDEEVQEYEKPKLIDWKCGNCGTMGKASVSKYNGHKHFRCEKCGMAFME